MSKNSISADEMDHYWMPFTPNQKFKKNPNILTEASGMFYRKPNGTPVLDMTAGLWCCNAGHGRREISEAIAEQVKTLDFASSFNLGHPLPFKVAHKIAQLTPPGLNKVFFTNSGSESVDTALKMALAYHQVRGQGSRQIMIGREKAYHGVGFGGISVGGIGANRKEFGNQLTSDHLPHTLLEENRMTKGLPQKGGKHLAKSLLGLIELHGANQIAAVIVEPIAGVGGVLLPPKGYLETLKSICQDHGILLIFDEVITGYGRLGTPFAANRFGISPDMIVSAKGLTSGVIPMGAVIAHENIYQEIVQSRGPGIEFAHGYTYSGHPVASAAALATLKIYEDEGLFERARELETYWQEAVHSLSECKKVVDIRNFGLVAGIQLEKTENQVGKSGLKAFAQAFDQGLLVRATGDTIAMSPPLIVEKSHIDQTVDLLRSLLSSDSKVS